MRGLLTRAFGHITADIFELWAHLARDHRRLRKHARAVVRNFRVFVARRALAAWVVRHRQERSAERLLGRARRQLCGARLAAWARRAHVRICVAGVRKRIVREHLHHVCRSAFRNWKEVRPPARPPRRQPRNAKRRMRCK